MYRNLSLIFSVILIGLSLPLLIWGIIPPKYQEAEVIINPTTMTYTPKEGGAPISIFETRQIRMKWPNSVRKGDVNTISLSFIPNAGGSLPGDQTQGLTDAYLEHNIAAEAEIQISGIKVKSVNPMIENMLPGNDLNFSWQVSSDRTGTNEGTAWLSLRFLPLDGSEPAREPVYVHAIPMKVNSLLGLSGPPARLVGGIGMISGSGIVIYDIVIARLKRKRKNSIKETEASIKQVGQDA